MAGGIPSITDIYSVVDTYGMVEGPGFGEAASSSSWSIDKRAGHLYTCTIKNKFLIKGKVEETKDCDTDNEYWECRKSSKFSKLCLKLFFGPPPKKKYSRYIISSGGVNKLYVLGLGPCTIIAVKMKTIWGKSNNSIFDISSEHCIKVKSADVHILKLINCTILKSDLQTYCGRLS